MIEKACPGEVVYDAEFFTLGDNSSREVCAPLKVDPKKLAEGIARIPGMEGTQHYETQEGFHYLLTKNGLAMLILCPADEAGCYRGGKSDLTKTEIGYIISRLPESQNASLNKVFAPTSRPLGGESQEEIRSHVEEILAQAQKRTGAVSAQSSIDTIERGQVTLDLSRESLLTPDSVDYIKHYKFPHEYENSVNDSMTNIVTIRLSDAEKLPQKLEINIDSKRPAVRLPLALGEIKSVLSSGDLSKAVEMSNGLVAPIEKAKERCGKLRKIYNAIQGLSRIVGSFSGLAVVGYLGARIFDVVSPEHALMGMGIAVLAGIFSFHAASLAGKASKNQPF